MSAAAADHGRAEPLLSFRENHGKLPALSFQLGA